MLRLPLWTSKNHKMVEFQYSLLENELQQEPLLSSYFSLYCQEEHLEEEVVRDVCYFKRQHCSFACISCTTEGKTNNIGNPSRPNIQIPRNHDYFWEKDELSTMFSKEEENVLYHDVKTDTLLAMARRDAVDWILKIHAYYSFSLHTAVLAVNYLDRFLFGFKYQRKKPWNFQLTAVACISLAAKIEETHVPLLLDLQVEETKYLFEAKTIQRMEILVLSFLEWKMNPVTPYSFLDYMIRRIGLKGHLCWEFLQRCEMVLLATVADFRFMSYLPSVVAAATMLHVIKNFEACIGEEYHSQLLGVLGINMDSIKECKKLILEIEMGGNISQSCKRKSVSFPRSTKGIIVMSFSCHSTNNSCKVSLSSMSSSPEPLAKKMRVDCQDSRSPL